MSDGFLFNSVLAVCPGCARGWARMSTCVRTGVYVCNMSSKSKVASSWTPVTASLTVSSRALHYSLCASERKRNNAQSPLHITFPFNQQFKLCPATANHSVSTESSVALSQKASHQNWIKISLYCIARHAGSYNTILIHNSYGCIGIIVIITILRYTIPFDWLYLIKRKHRH